jgi:hypothetical protein
VYLISTAARNHQAISKFDLFRPNHHQERLCGAQWQVEQNMAVSDDPHASDHDSDGEGLDEQQYQVILYFVHKPWHRR